MRRFVVFAILFSWFSLSVSAAEVPKELWGCWKVKRDLNVPGIVGLSQTQVNRIMETRIYYSSSCARSGKTVQEWPGYETSILSEEEFLDRLGNRPEQLGIHGKTVTIVDLRGVKRPDTQFVGNEVYLGGKNPVVMVEGVYFELEKLSPEASGCKCDSSESVSTIPTELWGCWVVKRDVNRSSNSELPLEQINQIIGTRIYYAESFAKSGRRLLNSPGYEITILSAQEFLESESLPLEKLEITGDTVTRVYLTGVIELGANFVGDEVYLGGKNPVVNVGGEFFELERINRAENGCTIEDSVAFAKARKELWGCWTVVRDFQVPGISGLTQEQDDQIVGTRLIYSDSCANLGGLALKFPVYQFGVLSGPDFFALTHAPLERLGITGTTTVVTLSGKDRLSPKFLGDTIFLGGKNPIVEVWGVYFELERATAEESGCKCDN